ncbi:MULTISPECIES: RNase adapter RapZ [Bombella]|uniref:RNase adapter RapZ n=1 Tax=Bombella pollinis TaxID=2967337 RepID=A0ABT3WQY8_9PROT|nr:MULTISPECIES: RNase adapter RapZ [Bombella]MCT6837430.1 RNase adapter RapZ [Bifidobacteriales bacterium]MCT6856063.1 RNase adapter RapZ [Bombella apis]MCX5620068.1 RNase adapter RapZ [Bombella pollinis]MUG05258.1 RNase adapter RapZ [Bombella sp. ESL0378]
MGIRAKEHSAQHIVLVTGLSGAGKASTLRMLEDLDYEVVDNPPLDLFEALVSRAGQRLAIGLDVRSRGFEAHRVADFLTRARRHQDCAVQLLFVTADYDVLLRRFTATRRRHPLAGDGGVRPALELEAEMLSPLRAMADLVIDTSDLPVPDLRQMINARFSAGVEAMLSVTLMSFAYPAGLPREADLVLDARFLRNPHYDETLRPHTGLEKPVADYVKADSFYQQFYAHVLGLIRTVLPRFAAEGKKYVTIAVGCSGGRHRSVTLIEALARDLAEDPMIDELRTAVMVVHRELAREGLASWRWAFLPDDAS